MVEVSPASAMYRTIYRTAQRVYVRLFIRDFHSLRIERLKGVSIVVLPGVFNGVLLRTGAFLATSLDASLVSKGSRVLDLGTGSGINAIFAARLGARVVATDINPEAVRCAQINALANHFDTQIETRAGDLFAPIEEEKFDTVLFNPPFYRGRPRDLADYAWRGTDVFDRFLRELPNHLNNGGRAIVVLSTDGDLGAELLKPKGLKVRRLRERDYINEKMTIYEIECAEESSEAEYHILQSQE